MHHKYFLEVVHAISCSPFIFENTENKQLIDGSDSGVHSVCFRGDFAIKTVSHIQAFIHMQYFLLSTNLVIVVFVHWASTGVLYEPQQC